jgi:PAS domain S-box-containing protein
VTAEFRLRHADGSWRDIEAIGQNLLDDPRIGAIVANYRDITDRKQAVVALRRERDLAESLIEGAPAVVFLLDPGGRIVRFNRFTAELTGYSLDEVRHADCFTTFLAERDRERIREVFRRTMNGIDTSGTINSIITRSGVEREIRWSNRNLRDTDGQVLGVLAIGHDITDLKEAQERALQTERLAAIGQMVSGLAHESRNALQRTQACLEMLALKVGDRPDALNLIDRIQNAQDDLHKLYDDVRNFAGPISLDRRCCDLSEIWREAWTNLESVRHGRNAVLREEPEGTPGRCAIDRFRMGQVFRNLMENALAASRDPVEIAIRCMSCNFQGQPAVRVSVRDNGPGLNSECRSKIFEPFFTTKTKGTGLGLSIARRIVEAHGGRLVAGKHQSPPGAEFVITLPCDES